MQKVNIQKDFSEKSVFHTASKHNNFKKEPFDLNFIEGTFQSAIDCSTTKVDTLQHILLTAP